MIRGHQKKTIVMAIFVLVALTACAAKQPPPMAGLSKLKGHSEIWLDKRVIQIDVKGSNEEKVDRLKDRAVMRAAELGKERNFEHLRHPQYVGPDHY